MEIFHEAEFWVAVGFVLVIALLVWKGVPAMVGKMLDQRSAAIAAELDEAKRLSAEAAALLTDYKKRAAGAMAAADARIEASRGAAKAHVADAARDAAIAIVARLTGETVSADEAAKAVRG